MNNEKRKRMNATQRIRRAKLIQIDYQNVLPEVKAIIDNHTHHAVGGDYSSIINKIILEWSSLKASDKLDTKITYKSVS